MLLNAALTTLCLIVVWHVVNWQHHADRVVAMFVVLTTSACWFFVWLVVRSRIPARPRWALVAAICGVAGLVAASVEIKGYTGDLVPIFGWRWAWMSGSGDEQFEPRQAKVDEEFDEARRPVDDIQFPVAPSWPRFLGENQNGEVLDVRLDPDWQQRPPKQLWRISIGEDAGFSSCVSAGGYFFTQQQDGDREKVLCYHVDSGTELWSYSYPARYESSLGGVGPRATPTLDDDQQRLYTLGATGLLHCFDAWSGEKIWSRDVVDQFGAQVLKWGNSCSPLVVDNLVVVSTGAGRKGPSDGGDPFATLVAYDKQTGETIWSAGDDDAGYSSPALMKLAGTTQIVVFNAKTVTGHDSATGQISWRYDWNVDRPSVAQPIALPGDGLLITKGYGEGARRLNISRDATGQWHAEEAWSEPRFLKTKFANSVIRGDHVFGISDGILECVEIRADGARRNWKARGNYGHGQLLLVGDLLLIQCENGDVALVEANPKQHVEVARMQAFDFRTWNSPILLGNRLLIRNDRQIACYELPTRDP
jgi:outer membrane protein assembly factor BamB